MMHKMVHLGPLEVEWRRRRTAAPQIACQIISKNCSMLIISFWTVQRNEFIPNIIVLCTSSSTSLQLLLLPLLRNCPLHLRAIWATTMVAEKTNHSVYHTMRFISVSVQFAFPLLCNYYCWSATEQWTELNWWWWSFKLNKLRANSCSDSSFIATIIIIVILSMQLLRHI